jgi:uncharacterized membrane protein HdeD (DUF308 family)
MTVVLMILSLISFFLFGLAGLAACSIASGPIRIALFIAFIFLIVGIFKVAVDFVSKSLQRKHAPRSCTAFPSR